MWNEYRGVLSQKIHFSGIFCHKKILNLPVLRKPPFPIIILFDSSIHQALSLFCIRLLLVLLYLPFFLLLSSSTANKPSQWSHLDDLDWRNWSWGETEQRRNYIFIQNLWNIIMFFCLRDVMVWFCRIFCCEQPFRTSFLFRGFVFVH